MKQTYYYVSGFHIVKAVHDGEEVWRINGEGVDALKNRVRELEIENAKLREQVRRAAPRLSPTKEG